MMNAEASGLPNNPSNPRHVERLWEALDSRIKQRTQAQRLALRAIFFEGATGLLQLVNNSDNEQESVQMAQDVFEELLEFKRLEQERLTKKADFNMGDQTLIEDENKDS